MSGERKEKVDIFSSSLLRDFNEEEFNRHLAGATADIHLFRGKKANEIRKHVESHLKTSRPDSVIIVCGGNDFRASGKPSADEISDSVIEIGMACLKANIPPEHVRISSILPRDQDWFIDQREQVNDLLREKCKAKNFLFIDNGNIMISRHIKRDCVHLNNAGTVKLANNLIKVLNGGTRPNTSDYGSIKS